MSKKLGISLVSITFCIAVLGIGEIFCRYFLDINLRKTSRSFLVTDAHGRVIRNASNAEGTSFGVPVWSDENGFRVPQNYVPPESDSAALFLGDSVTFGVGVPEEKTFVGLFRRAMTDVRVYNSAVVGYSIPDYKRVAETFLPSHREVNRVYLIYCLNDFHPVQGPEKRPEKEDGSFVPAIKHAVSSSFMAINEFLGPRSKLYVYITGMTADPSRRYFEWDLSLMNVSDEVLAEILAPIVEIDRMVEGRNGQFTVVINPYEMQVRHGNYEPQRRIEQHLAAQNVHVLDTREGFHDLQKPENAFLFADPMHLNETGHRIVFDALMNDLQNKR